MCKLNSKILAFLCILSAIHGILHAESSVVLRPSADALCTSNPFISFTQDFVDDGYFADSHRFIYEYSTDRPTPPPHGVIPSVLPISLKDGTVSWLHERTKWKRLKDGL